MTQPNQSPTKITMFVHNDCSHDARVLKEAKTLADAGFKVKIIAIEKDGLPNFEERDGFVIERVSKGAKASTMLFEQVNKIISRIVALKTKALKWLNEKNPPLIAKIGLGIIALPLALFYLVGIVGYKIWRRVMISLFSFAPFLNVFTGFYSSAFKAAKKDPADIYHAHDLNTLPAGLLAKKRLGGKLIYDSHELYVERNLLKPPSAFSKKMTMMLEKFLLKHTDQTITVNSSIAKILQDRYNLKNLPAVVMNAPAYNVIDKPKSLRMELGISAGSKIAIYSGALTFNRGIEELIKSLQYLDGYNLVLMGYGNETFVDSLKKVAVDAGVSDRLKFFGPVPHEEVPVWVAGADVGVAPILNAALSYYLCTPNKLFEYVQAGLPVVSSNFPEMSKVVSESKIGYTFEPTDPQDIARSIKQVFEDEEKYQQLKLNAKEAAKIYNWENESAKLLKVYEDLGFKINKSNSDTFLPMPELTNNN